MHGADSTALDKVCMVSFQSKLSLDHEGQLGSEPPTLAAGGAANNRRE